VSTAIPTPADLLAGYLTGEQVCSAFGGISYYTLLNWVKREGFPRPRKVGRKCYWLAAEIRAHLDALGRGGAHAV
jgi:predicted DNA-binding transcriptional regulator AlpA